MVTKNHWLEQDLHIFTNGCDYVIASSLEEAREITMPLYGYALPYEELDEMGKEELDYEGWEQFPDNKEFTLTQEDGEKVVMKASEWVKQHGKGYFACSEF